MLASRMIHAPVCASCRLRTAIATKQLARCRKPTIINTPRWSAITGFSTSTVRAQHRPSTDEAKVQGQEQERKLEQSFADPEAEEEGVRYAERLLERGIGQQSPEKAALIARERYGASLPEGVLGEEAERVYVRLYGDPLRVRKAEVEERLDVLRGSDVEGLDEAMEGEEGKGPVVLREGKDGGLEEVEVLAEEVEEEMEEFDEEEDLEIDEDVADDDVRLSQDIQSALSRPSQHELETKQEDEDEPSERAHPLTTATRFGTSPTTLPLPTATLIDPIAAELAGTNNKHLSSAAHRSLGGLGLPYGPATPARAKTMQARPIQIDAFQHNVSAIEGDVFLAAIFPAVYASVVSVLTETRKRLGSAWAEGLVRKAESGELRILDAGGGGAGVLAVREMLRAEWERMMEEREGGLESSMALAEAGGKFGGPGVSPPLGNATVVTGSDVLRHRAAKLLENTTFIPRLPDYVHTVEQKTKGKFDLVIAPHTLWGGLRFDRERKTHVQNLWSLLDAEGGVLVLVEKGVARGFEVVAGAREMLLRTRIQSFGSRGTEFDENAYSGAEIEWEGAEEVEDAGEEGLKTASEAPSREQETTATTTLVWEKEKGTIIAPCTNHVACPMYRPRGFLKGRRDICAFEQRYVRPSFLQRILGAKDKNFEDVAFSYLSVMRGRDLLEERGVVQGEEANEGAFAGHEAGTHSEANDGEGAAGAVSALALPRQVLPPLKKKGHVLLDLCTPAGTLERWTVPRSFSRQAFRDARKSGWGDLWALGAKTRIPRGPRVGLKHGGKMSKGQRAELRALEGGSGVGAKGELVQETILDTDAVGRVAAREARDDVSAAGKGGKVGRGKLVGGGGGEGGRMRTGAKVGGLRDKRDKSGGGNGRRRMRWGGDE